jgi:tetratricopeptide (TPR) repeat protein
MEPKYNFLSLQQILDRRRNQEVFVGRDEYTNQFRRNLTLDLLDPQRLFVFSVFGQAGVGKTWLLRRFREIARDAGALVALTDETHEDVLAVMQSISSQIGHLPEAFQEFTEQLTLYRRRRHELEADPEATQLFGNAWVRTLAKGGVKAGRRIPAAGILFDFVSEETASSRADEWAAFVARKLAGKPNEVILVQEPVQVLTPLFLRGLRQSVGGSTLALFFDTYERTAVYLDGWIRDVLSGQYGIVPGKIVISIAGQHELRRHHWESQEGIIARLQLDPFSPEEAREYLACKGVVSPEVIDTILQLSGCVPVLVATLAAGNPTDAAEVGDPTGTAVERYLRWVDDTRQRQLVLDASLPRRLNHDVVAVLTGAQDVVALFDWLRGMPFCQDRGAEAAGWAYHSLVRAQMLRYKYREAPRSWGELHSRLAEFYDSLRESLQLTEQEGLRDAMFQSYLTESLYHRLCQAPHKFLSVSLNHFLTTFSIDRTLARRVAIAISDAGADVANPELREWGNRLAKGTDAYEQQNAASAIGMFAALLEGQDLHEQQRSIALARRGYMYQAVGQYDKSLLDLNEALRIDPDDVRYLELRSITYSALGQHDRAFADLHHAMQIKRNDSDVLITRAKAYRALGRYEEALSDFDRALEIDPVSDWILAMRGNTYFALGRYEEALSDFDRALEIDPNYAFALAGRGSAYTALGRYEEALSDLDRALEIDPNYHYALARRGRVFSALGRYEEALADLDHVLETDPSNDWVLAIRGEVHLNLHRYEEALADLSRALEIDPGFTFALSKRADVHENLGRYEEALADLDRELEIDPGFGSALARRGRVFSALGRYEEALADLSRALEIDPTDEFALSQRADVHIALYRFQEALSDLDRALEIDPNYDYALARRGRCYHQLGRYEEALADLTSGIESDPNNSWWLGQRGQTFLLQGQYQPALSDLDQALSLAPNDRFFRYVRALIYKMLGSREMADRELETALGIAREDYGRDPSDWPAAICVALFQLADGNSGAALSTYQEVLDRGCPVGFICEAIHYLTDFINLFPDSDDALVIRERLEGYMADHL